MLALETGFMDRPPNPEDRATVGLIDLERDGQWRPLASTRAWNWQQGSMLQWLGQDPDRLILYNTRDQGRCAASIHDIHSGETTPLPRPVYALAPDGESALSVNFARIHRHRPGYGYIGADDPWADQPHPAADGIHRLDLRSGRSELIVSLDQIARLDPHPSTAGVWHWFNHLQYSPDGQRFCFLHRWVGADGRRRSRLFTARPDGSQLYCLADDDLVSHFDWRDPGRLLAWARRKDIGDYFLLFTDQTDQVEVLGRDILSEDGHCSFSPEGRWLLTDTYPDADSQRTLILYDLQRKQRHDIGSFYALPHISGEIRCDLHPRWNRDGTQLCFDSVHEGTRQMYCMDLGKTV